MVTVDGRHVALFRLGDEFFAHRQPVPRDGFDGDEHVSAVGVADARIGDNDPEPAQRAAPVVLDDRRGVVHEADDHTIDFGPASIFVYWGIYWPPIREAAPLIAAQIVFAYAFDMLLAWSRRDTYTLGFGPFPIIFSTNLFMRFRDDWFSLQFLMVAVGFLAKELIRWEKDGRRTHIFNPSSFTLALFSLVLIVTGTTRITWGEEIATLLILPPQIYLFIFLVALPGQFLFRRDGDDAAGGADDLRCSASST